MTYEHILRYSSAVRVIVGLTVITSMGMAVGCTRDAAPAECPTLGAGELVLTEFRGPTDTEKAWVELYNASTATVDLEGTKIRFRKLDGSSEVPVLVRRSLEVAAGAYVVLGLVNDDSSKPAYIDYGFALDFHMGFLSAAAVDVEACGTRIDLARYPDLPDDGTYSLGGTPDANRNEDPAAWCINPTAGGTPQQPNPPCP
jgi:hypothetical protein